MIHIIAHALWIIILAVIAIAAFGWLSLVFVIALAGIVISVLLKGKKQNIAVALTAIAEIAYAIIYMQCFMD